MMKRIVNGATLLFLMVLLVGCATPKPEVIRVPFETVVIEKERVPSELLEPCPEPSVDKLETTGDLERVALEGIAAAKCGNADKAAIREWQSE